MGTPEVVQELSADSMPRVKLTGTGKMPVADMRNSQCGQMSMSSGQLTSGQLPSGQMASGQLSSVQLNGQHLASGHPTVSGLPPKSPLYALVNKVSKKKSPPTNISLPPKNSLCCKHCSITIAMFLPYWEMSSTRNLNCFKKYNQTK